MKFLSLKAENFMSFEELDYIFPQIGLYFVGGDVQDGTISSSNRAGKSVFATEVLSYGLFGRTVRGISADSVVKREVGKDCCAEIILEDDNGECYIVRRYRKHKEHSNDLLLFKSGEDKPITGADVYETQKMIDKILGMNWLVFSTAIIFGEKAKRFIEAGDSEKKEVFDEILMFQHYQQAQQAVKDDLNKLVAENETREHVLGGMKTGLDEINTEFTLNEEALKGVEEEKGDIRSLVDSKVIIVIDLDGKLKIAKETCGETKKDLGVLEEEDEKLMAYVKKVREDETEVMAALAKISRNVHDKLWPVTYRINEIDEWLDKKNDLPKGTRCKVCGSEITIESVVGCAKHYAEERENLIPKKKELEVAQQVASEMEQTEAKKWDEKLEASAKTKDGLDKEVRKQRNISQQAESDMLKLENEITLIKQEIQHLDSSYEEKETMFLEKKKRLGEKIADYEEKIKTLERKIQTAEEEVVYLKFWVEGFGPRGIKSLLLDEILPQLNSRADYYGSVLLDNEIRMEFDTEAMLKSGEVRDKFSIKLLIDNEDVEYKSCSSGEKGRIDAAVLLALQNLIFERSNCASSLVIFDEIFEHLDKIGIERIVNLLNEEAKDKAIFCISHQNEFADYFDHVLMVKKKDGVSVLEI